MDNQELIKQNIEVLKSEERNLTLVLRRIQQEISEATSNKKKVQDSTEALSKDKETAVAEYQEWVKKSEDLKTQVSEAWLSLDEAKAEVNKIRSEVSSERAKVETERNQLENDKSSHQVEKSNLAEDKRDFQARVEKLNKALE